MLASVHRLNWLRSKRGWHVIDTVDGKTYPDAVRMGDADMIWCQSHEISVFVVKVMRDPR